MTLDEAIKHCLEVAERYETRAKIIDRRKLGSALENPTACHECAADHRQLAEWLTDYKELKNSIGAVKLKDMKEAVELLQELNIENDQLTSQLAVAKRLLKAAVEDFAAIAEVHAAATPILCPQYGKYLKAIDVRTRKWRYTDEAEKLLNDEK